MNPTTLLEQIQPVEAPEFLFTRIQERIDREYNNNAPTPLIWTFGFSFLILFLVNITIISTSIWQAKPQDNVSLQLQNIIQENNLYS